MEKEQCKTDIALYFLIYTNYHEKKGLSLKDVLDSLFKKSIIQQIEENHVSIDVDVNIFSKLENGKRSPKRYNLNFTITQKNGPMISFKKGQFVGTLMKSCKEIGSVVHVKKNSKVYKQHWGNDCLTYCISEPTTYEYNNSKCKKTIRFVIGSQEFEVNDLYESDYEYNYEHFVIMDDLFHYVF